MDFASMTSHTSTQSVITDLTVTFFADQSEASTPGSELRTWHRIDKELFLHSHQQCAWLYTKAVPEESLSVADLIVSDIRTSDSNSDPNLNPLWEARPGGIWILREQFRGGIQKPLTGIDVLFGVDAVDPRAGWNLLQSPLDLGSPPELPIARLSVLRGHAKQRSGPRAPLRVNGDGIFKIVQLSDTHMVNGVGVCKDAIDETGKRLPPSEADPLTVEFIGQILDIEQPDLVVLTGDQVHHDVVDSQSALFKVVAPIIQRSIPFAAVFGNHDSEGTHALSRERLFDIREVPYPVTDLVAGREQMCILQDLPFSMCEAGPDEVDGVGNFHLQILEPVPSQLPVSSLYFLDSHGQIPSKTRGPDYDPIQQSQIDWFVDTSRAHSASRHADKLSLSLVFQHIPLPEFGSHRLSISNGSRQEPTEGPSVNTHFYDALVAEGIVAIGCGHDHVNDFCALFPSRGPVGGDKADHSGPWLCYSGTCGFGGYCSYGRKRFFRRVRVWELDTHAGRLKTWKRLERTGNRVDELVLVENGSVVDSTNKQEKRGMCVLS